MKTVSDILRRDPVWVNPAHGVKSAIWLMRGYDIGCMPVLDGARLVGMVLYKHLLNGDDRRRVDEVMDPHVTVVPSTLSIREAADLMVGENADCLPVINAEDILLGVITPNDLLVELRRSVDPLTELPWSDTLREWAIEQLIAGKELTLLFIDVNDFGQFNKRYGHVVGDAVLRNVANVLRDLTDTALDSLCRYGGDEFCIATLRSAPEASALADRIVEEVADLRVMEARDHGISATVGQRGGRRTREREHIHYAATLNSLINLASRDCMMNKTSHARTIPEAHEESDRQPGPDIPTEDPGPIFAYGDYASEPQHGDHSGRDTAVVSDRLRLSMLNVSWVKKTVHVQVELERGRFTSPSGAPGTREGASQTSGAKGRDSRDLAASQEPGIAYTSVVTGVVDNEGVPALVAEATISAMRRALPAGYDIRLGEVISVRTADEKTLATVVGHFVTPAGSRPVAGSAFVNADLHHAIASAVLAAMNRQIAQVLRMSGDMATRP